MGHAGRRRPSSLHTRTFPDQDMHRCLIVDGSPLIRKVTRIILTDFGYAVLEAQTGHEALAQFRRHAPSLVIVDSRLSDMSALDVLRQIRDASGGKAHALYCTVDYDVVELQQAHAAG